MTVREHGQLELFDALDDGLTFGQWVESLPLDPAESLGRGAMTLFVASGERR